MNKHTNLDALLENNTNDHCDMINMECLYWPLLFDSCINCPCACECKASYDLLDTWVQRAKDLGLYDQFAADDET